MSSGKCGNCDCADQSQCTKKGYSFDIVETDESFVDAVVMDASVAENDGKCKCGTTCPCTDCTCGH